MRWYVLVGGMERLSALGEGSQGEVVCSGRRYGASKCSGRG